MRGGGVSKLEVDGVDGVDDGVDACDSWPLSSTISFYENCHNIPVSKEQVFSASKTRRFS